MHAVCAEHKWNDRDLSNMVLGSNAAVAYKKPMPATARAPKVPIGAARADDIAIMGVR